MAEPQEGKTERLTFALTPTELRALDFIRRIHGDKYEGTSSVLRDYSIEQAVQAYTTAMAVVPAAQPVA